MRKILFGLSLAFLVQSAHAQQRFAFEQEINTKVFRGTDTVLNPWAGGLNYPVFNNFDFNFDGMEDLLVFDRSGKRLLCLVHELINGDTVLRFRPEYREAFPIPRGEGSFVLMRDYNCDGKDDIFYSDGRFIRVFENTSSGGQISFVPANNGNDLDTRYGASGVSKLYVPSSDLPDINDVDGDGDLDILTFGNGGVNVEFHENTSSSNCGLNFEVTGSCWGLFEEGGLYRQVQLQKCQSGNKRKTGKVMHSGSAMLSWDMDNNNVVDLLLSNVSYNNLSYLNNGGTLDSSVMTSQDTMYPPNKPVDLFIFPAPYRVETNLDGQDDLVLSSFSSASSGSPDMSSNHRGIWRFKNTGTSSQPNFVFDSDNYLQGDMFDPGAASIPRFADLNGDGLMDLVLSIANRFQQPGISTSQFYYFENTGNSQQAEFTLVDTNFADILQYNLGTEIVPTFGDLDNDGDLDLIVGAISGYFHYIENIGSRTNPSFNINTPIITNTDVGADAAPYLFDLDEDGDLDLFVGNEQGRVYWFENSSLSTPTFNLKSSFFGAVNVSELGLSGNAVPVFHRDSTGSTLFVGSRTQGIIQYDQLDTIASLPGNIYDSLGNASDTSVNSDQTLFGISKRSGRNQFLILASELQAKGFLYGFIESLGFNIIDKGGSVFTNGFTIKIKNTSATSLSSFEDNFPTPYPVEDYIFGFGNGWNTVPLQFPFLWDGQSNLVIEVCFSGNFPDDDIIIGMTDKGFPCHAIGDISNFNNLSADGCAMPYLNTITSRPDVWISLTPALIPVPNQFVSDLYVGERSNADFTDLNGDGYLDAIAGNLRGGMSLFHGKLYDLGDEEESLFERPRVNVYPNPNSGSFRVDIPASIRHEFTDLRLFSTQGQLIHEQDLRASTEVNLTGAIAPGLYLGILQNGLEVLNFRVLVGKTD